MRHGHKKRGTSANSRPHAHKLLVLEFEVSKLDGEVDGSRMSVTSLNRATSSCWGGMGEVNAGPLQCQSHPVVSLLLPYLDAVHVRVRQAVILCCHLPLPVCVCLPATFALHAHVPQHNVAPTVTYIEQIEHKGVDVVAPVT